MGEAATVEAPENMAAEAAAKAVLLRYRGIFQTPAGCKWRHGGKGEGGAKMTGVQLAARHCVISQV